MFYDENEAIFCLDAPYMWDANEQYSDDIAVQLTAVAGGYIYTLTPNGVWLNDAKRVFPVTIDPTVEAVHEYGVINNATGVYSSTIPAELEKEGESKYLKVGKKGRYTDGVWGTYEATALFQTDLPAQISKTSRIIDAWLQPKMYVGDKYQTCTTNTRINAYAISSSWSAGTTQVISCSGISYQSSVMDYIVCNDSTATDGRIYEVDITDAAQKWATGQLTNYGIMLRGSGLPTDTSERYARFYSSKYADDRNYCPTFIFTYRDTQGLEGYWTYTTMDAGVSGTAAVNNFNGNLVVVQNLCGVDGLRMPVGISLVYNASQTETVSYTGLGLGWRTNFHIRVFPETNTRLKDTYPYYFIDADGTQHYFYKQDDGSLIDEDGLGYTLTVSGSGNTLEYIIEDKSDGQMVFNSDGCLTSIYDANNYDDNSTNRNRIRVQYTSAGLIDVIYDGAERAYKFQYTDGLLTSITDPADRITTITRPSSSLDIITYPDGRKTQINYTTAAGSPAISTIYNASGESVRFQYNSRRRVSAQFFFGEATCNTQYTFDYTQHNTTTITDLDNKQVVYQFNNAGQTVSVINKQSGQAQYYAYGAPGITDVKTALNGAENHLLNVSKTHAVIDNLVVNPHFDRGTTGYAVYGSATNQTYTVTHDTTMGYIDGESIKITQTATKPGRVWLYRDISGLEAGTYTASVYMNTDGDTLTGSGGIISLKIVDATTNAILRDAYSPPLLKTTTWERQQVSIQLNAGEKLRVLVGFKDEAVGTLWVDGLQVEAGEVANHFNLLENPCFTGSTTNWNNATRVTTADDVPFGDQVLQLAGVYTSTRNIFQTVLAEGIKGDVFRFGGWAKASSVPLGIVKPGNVARTAFRLRVEFYLDSVLQSFEELSQHAIDFSPSVDGWQFVSGQVIAPAAYNSVRLYFDYNHNANTAYLGGCLLYKDTFGQSYTYDEDGNVVSTVDLAEAETTFAYQDDQLSKLLNPTGSHYLYSYDRYTKTLNYAHTSDGQRYTIDYDRYGNVVSTKVNVETHVTSLSANTAYVLRNAADGSTLSSEPNQDLEPVYTQSFWNTDDRQHWTLIATSTSGVYQLRSVYDPSTALDLKGGWTEDGTPLQMATYSASNTNQQFEFRKNSDDTFTLLTKTLDADGNKKCIDAANKPESEDSGLKTVEQQPDTGKKSQKWYLYTVKAQYELDENPYMYSEAYYKTGGNYLEFTTDTLGNQIEYDYDAQNGNLNAVLDARGNATTYTYDVLGRPKTVIAKSGDADSTTNLADVAYNYHVNGGIDNIQYNEGKGKYLFLYDEFGRNDMVWIGIGDSLRCVVENDYNSRNLLIGQNYGNGKSVNFAYDSLDRLVGKGYNGNTSTFTYAYDAEGRLALEKDTVNNTRTRYTYDMAGRLVQWTQRNGASVDSGDILAQIQYRYNAKNQPSFLFYQHAGVARLGYQYIYGYGRLRDKVTQVRDGAVYRLSYGYDLLGRRSSRQLQVTEDTFPNVSNAVQTTYTYVDHPTDENRTSGLLESVTHSINYVPFYRAVYTYDANGNITSITEGVNETTTVSYEYDALNQLVRVNDEKNDVTYRYAYDKAGNLLSRTPFAYTTGALGSASSDALYSYGDSGWCDLLTSYNGTAITYDDIGNPLNWRDGMSFMWQNGRQLYMMSHYGVSALYNYNADGLRTKKMYGGTTTTYYWANGLLLGEVRTNGNTLTYLYDENSTMYGFELNGVRYYYLYNGQGDVIGLIDATGAVIAHYEYDAWGKLLSVTDANGEEILYGTEVAIINPIRYRGYYYDNETGFYYLNSRYYDPEVGRWINADNNFSNYNLFMYCGNNPVNRIDPNGEHWYYLWIDDLIEAVDELMASVSNIVYGRAAYERSYYDPKGANDLWNTRPFQDTKPSQEMQIFTEFMYDHDFVADISVSVDTPIKNTYVKVGASKVLSPNKNIDASYVHAGIGTSTPSVLPINISYSVGIVNGVKAKENYAKHFLDIGAGAIYGFDYCWWPNGASAYSFTIGTSYGVYGGYDYYWCLD